MIFIIGNISLSVISYIPQILLLIKNKNSTGISKIYIYLHVLGHILNFGIGLYKELLNLIIISFYHLIVNLLVLFLVLYYSTNTNVILDLFMILFILSFLLSLYLTENNYDTVPWISTSIFISSTCFQLTKTYHTGHVKNISLSTYLLKYFSNISFLLSLVTNTIVQTLPWLIGICFTLFIDTLVLLQYLFYNKTISEEENVIIDEHTSLL